MRLVKPALAGLAVAMVSVALAALVGVTAQTGAQLLAGGVALAVVCLALGWAELLGLEHARNSTAAVIAGSGLAATALALVTAEEIQPLAAFAVLLAGSVLLAFAHQLVRRDGRARLVESLTATVSGQVIAVLGAGWVLLHETRMGQHGLIVAAASAAASSAAVAAPVRRGLRGWAAFAAGLVASLVAILILGADDASGSLLARLLVGLSVSAVASGTALLLASQRSAARPLGVLAAGAAPICAVGTVAYAVARLSGG